MRKDERDNIKKKFHFLVYLVLVFLLFTNLFASSSTAKIYGEILTTGLPVDEYYYSNGSWNPINETITPKSLTISGRTYEYGCDTGWYEAYFREQSSDVKDRPMAMVSDNYTLTLSPKDFVVLEPHKYATNGRVGNRVISDAVVSENDVSYPGFYEKIGTSGSFANVTFEYTPEFLKENFVIWDKAYVLDRFSSQCKEEDYSIVNLTFSEIIRAYDTSDQDNMTSGIVFGTDMVSFKEFGMFADNEIITNETIYFTDSNNETVYSIRQLYAYDSDNNSILLDKKLSMTLAGNLEISILVPYWWLNETAVFPVYVDPTVYGYIEPSTVDEYEYQPSEGRMTGQNGLVRINDTQYYLSVASGDNGNTYDGWVRTIQVYDDGTFNKTEISSYEYDTSYSYYANIVHIPGTDKYLIAYGGSTAVTLVTIQAKENGIITQSIIDTQITLNGGQVHILPLTDNIYAIAYFEQGSDDGYLETYWINYTGAINNTYLDSEEFDETSAIRPYLCKVDNDTIVLTYGSGGANGEFTILTYDIVNGVIADTPTDTWMYETEPNGFSTITKVGDTTYEIVYSDANDDVQAKTLTISDDGTITKSWIDTLTVYAGTNSEYITLFDVMNPLDSASGKGVVGMTLKGDDGDGFIFTWNITEEGYLDDAIISQYEFDTSDNVRFADVEWVADGYYLIVYSSSSVDGWAKTIMISTNYHTPVISNEYPMNGSSGVITTPTCSITINDADGDLMNIYWYENTTSSWVLRKTISNATNGTYYWNFSQAYEQNTIYNWRVVVTDYFNSVQETYWFKTFAVSFFFTDESPYDGQMNVKLYPYLNLTIENEFGQNFDLTWYITPDSLGTVVLLTLYNQTNGTYSVNLADYNNSDFGFYGWNYTWSVLATVNGTVNSISSPDYSYKTLYFNYDMLGVDVKMNVYMIILWIVIWAILLFVNIKARSAIFGGFAGMWLFLLGIFIIVTGIQLETGTITTILSPSQSVNYVQYSNAILPYSTYSFVWGVFLFVLAIYILIANARAKASQG